MADHILANVSLDRLSDPTRWSNVIKAVSAVFNKDDRGLALLRTLPGTEMIDRAAAYASQTEDSLGFSHLIQWFQGRRACTCATAFGHIPGG